MLIKKIVFKVSGLLLVLRFTKFIKVIQQLLSYLEGKGVASDFRLSGEIPALASVLPSRPIIFDVGANNGEWSVLLANKLDNAEFYLFECAPICLQEIEFRLPRIPNNHLVTVAVSNSDGFVSLMTPLRGSGLASIHEREDVSINKETYEKIEVPCIKLDTYINENKINHVDLLKMDIEGHELMAIQGAMDAISDRKIQNIMFEFGSANVNSRTYFRDFWKLLNDKYDIYRIMPNGSLYRLYKYEDELEYFRGSTNYLARLKDNCSISNL